MYSMLSWHIDNMYSMLSWHIDNMYSMLSYVHIMTVMVLKDVRWLQF